MRMIFGGSRSFKSQLLVDGSRYHYGALPLVAAWRSDFRRLMRRALGLRSYDGLVAVALRILPDDG